MHGDSKYNCWVQPNFAWHAADELSHLEQAKLVWGHHVTLRWPPHFTSVLIFWAATTNPLDVDFPDVAFLWAWIGITAGVFGIFSISPGWMHIPFKDRATGSL